MSWRVTLEDDKGEIVQVALHRQGEPCVIGDSSRALLDVAKGYDEFFLLALDEHKGLQWLTCRTAQDCEDRLRAAVEKLGDDPQWAETQGDAGHVLGALLRWAEQYPEAVFDVH